MDAIERVLAALIEIERPRPERILRASGHHVGRPPAILAQLPRDHLLRRMPLRPGPHEADLRDARPLETLPPDPDAVTDRLAVRQHVVEPPLARVDDDRAGRFLGLELDHFLAAVTARLPPREDRPEIEVVVVAIAASGECRCAARNERRRRSDKELAPIHFRLLSSNPLKQFSNRHQAFASKARVTTT